jgi:hypothetical protein
MGCVGIVTAVIKPDTEVGSVTLRTRTEMVLETSVLSIFNQLTRLEAREDYSSKRSVKISHGFMIQWDS